MGEKTVGIHFKIKITANGTSKSFNSPIFVCKFLRMLFSSQVFEEKIVKVILNYQYLESLSYFSYYLADTAFGTTTQKIFDLALKTFLEFCKAVWQEKVLNVLLTKHSVWAVL